MAIYFKKVHVKCYIIVIYYQAKQCIEYVVWNINEKFLLIFFYLFNMMFLPGINCSASMFSKTQHQR